MPNQKGSVKDRLRARFRFLQYKKLKKKKEKELQKKQKKLEKERVRAEQIRLYGKSYNKAQVFGYSVLGLFIGIFTPNGSPKKVSKELQEIELQIAQIVLDLEQDKTPENIYIDLDNAYQKLDTLKTKYKNSLVAQSFFPVGNNSMIKKIDEKKKELEVLNEICHTKEKQNTFNSIEKEQFDKMNGNQEKDLFVSAENKIELKTKSENKTVETPNLKKGEKSLLNDIKKMNQTLKDYDKRIKELDEKIEKEQSYNGLYDYEFSLKQLRLRLQEVLENYKKLKEYTNLELLNEYIEIETIDKYELHKDESSIRKMIEQCHLLLNRIEEKKTSFSEKKNDIVQKKISSDGKEEKKAKKKNNKEEEKKELKEQFDDVYLANKIILDHILKEKRTIDKLKRQISHQPITIRKRTMFYYTKNITNSILNFGFSLMPFHFFRNRFLGSLVTGVMLNNSLRSVRRIFTVEKQEINYLFYQNILNEIRSKQDYIYHISNVCYDSLNQIQNIKEYLGVHYSMIREYDTDLADFYNQLEQLEAKISSQIIDLEKMNSNYDEVKRKVKIRNDKYIGY